MPFHKFSDIKLGLLQHLHLADVAIFDGEDGRGLLDDLVTDVIRNEFLYESPQVTLCSKFLHGCDHLGTDSPNLCGLGVASILDLIRLLFGESDAEHSHDVPISCSAVHIGFNDGLLLSDQTAKLITGHVHAVEIEQTVETLDILHTKLDLSESRGFVLVEVSEADFDDTSLKSLRSDLSSLRLGDEGATAVLHRKDGGSNELVPFFLEKGVSGLFSASLLALCQSLVLSL